MHYFYNSHPLEYEVVFSCGFELHFPNDWQCWTSFTGVTDCSSVFGGVLEEYLLISFIHFGVLWSWLFCGAIWRTLLLILTSIWDAWCINILYSIAFLFALLIVSYNSICLCFPFCCLYIWHHVPKSNAKSIARCSFFRSFSKSFMSLDSMIGSLIDCKVRI